MEIQTTDSRDWSAQTSEDWTEVCIEIWTHGTLGIQFQLIDGKCLINGFEKDNAGSVGEIERDGRVDVGDILISVNSVPVIGMNMDQIQEIVRSSVENMPRSLLFKHFHQTGVIQQAPRSPHFLSGLVPLRRIDIFHSIISERLISEGKLRNIAASGVPDQQGIRGIVWRLLLRVLPLDTESWGTVVQQKRMHYNQKCAVYFQPGSTTLKRPCSPHLDLDVQTSLLVNHPLSDENDIYWKEHLCDMQLFEEIEKDVIRTHPDISFFIDEGNNFHVKDSMMRILFVFAKEHPTVRYVQGMNDLCGTLFYVLGTDECAEWQQHAEADTYSCFESLVMENQDMYIKTKDSTETGIHGRIQQFIDLLRVHDNEIFVIFRKQGIDPSFYGLRWLTTLLCREFNLADTIRVWDALFADTDRSEFLSYVCCTMVIMQRSRLVGGDFASNLQLLQSYPHVDITLLLAEAMKLRSQDRIRALASGASSSASPGSGLGLGWVDSMLAEEDFDEEQSSYLRHPRLQKAIGIGANLVGAISNTGTAFFNGAEAGVRKLFSDRSSAPLWPLFSSGTSNTSSDQQSNENEFNDVEKISEAKEEEQVGLANLLKIN